LRAIVGSQAYQRTSRVTDPSQKESRLFARMAVKGLSPEQLYDSLVQVTGFRDLNPTPNPRLGPLETNARARFLAKFANQDKRTEYQTSILQALALMNGSVMQDITSRELITKSELPGTLGSVVLFYEATASEGPGKPIRTLFRQTLGRNPSK